MNFLASRSKIQTFEMKSFNQEEELIKEPQAQKGSLLSRPITWVKDNPAWAVGLSVGLLSAVALVVLATVLNHAPIPTDVGRGLAYGGLGLAGVNLLGLTGLTLANPAKQGIAAVGRRLAGPRIDHTQLTQILEDEQGPQQDDLGKSKEVPPKDQKSNQSSEVKWAGVSTGKLVFEEEPYEPQHGDVVFIDGKPRRVEVKTSSFGRKTIDVVDKDGGRSTLRSTDGLQKWEPKTGEEVRVLSDGSWKEGTFRTQWPLGGYVVNTGGSFPEGYNPTQVWPAEKKQEPKRWEPKVGDQVQLSGAYSGPPTFPLYEIESVDLKNRSATIKQIKKQWWDKENTESEKTMKVSLTNLTLHQGS